MKKFLGSVVAAVGTILFMGMMMLIGLVANGNMPVLTGILLAAGCGMMGYIARTIVLNVLFKDRLVPGVVIAWSLIYIFAVFGSVGAGLGNIPGMVDPASAWVPFSACGLILFFLARAKGTAQAQLWRDLALYSRENIEERISWGERWAGWLSWLFSWLPGGNVSDPVIGFVVLAAFSAGIGLIASAAGASELNTWLIIGVTFLGTIVWAIAVHNAYKRFMSR